MRWQIELVFKRLKTLVQMGHVPWHDDGSSRAWVYGKLLIALLTQKLIRSGHDISPAAIDSMPQRPPSRGVNSALPFAISSKRSNRTFP